MTRPESGSSKMRAVTVHHSDSESSSLAVDLANTVACDGCRATDGLASLGEARRWVRSKFPRDRSRVSLDDLATLRRLRSNVRFLFRAAADRSRPSPKALAAVNDSASGPPTRSRLSWSRRRWVLRAPVDDRPAAQRLASVAARSALALLSGPLPPRVRPCEGLGCAHYVLVRRAEQRWCSPTGCGNRARVRRHYRKVRAIVTPRSRRRLSGHSGSVPPKV